MKVSSLLSFFSLPLPNSQFPFNFEALVPKVKLGVRSRQAFPTIPIASIMLFTIKGWSWKIINENSQAYIAFSTPLLQLWRCFSSRQQEIDEASQMSLSRAATCGTLGFPPQEPSLPLWVPSAQQVLITVDETEIWMGENDMDVITSRI